MHPFNLLLSQFFCLCLFVGSFLWAVLSSLLDKMGFHGSLAAGLAGFVSILLIALVVFRRRIFNKEKSMLDKSQLGRRYQIGSAFITFGNISFILAIIIMPLSSPVVGGIAVLVGGGISLISWLFGWHLTAYLKII